MKTSFETEYDRKCLEKLLRGSVGHVYDSLFIENAETKGKNFLWFRGQFVGLMEEDEGADN